MLTVETGEAEPQPIFFRRPEIDAILSVYGRMVAAGEWRDYAIDFTRERALFSVFRRTSESPLYEIEKCPALSRRQGAFCVRAADGRILRRGHDLGHVLKLFDRQLFRLVSAE
jgi:hypothetical protein